MDNVTPVTYNQGVAGTNPFDILLPTWSGEVLHAYDSYKTFEGMVTSRVISSGTELEIPVTGKVDVKEVWGRGEAIDGGGGPTNSFKIALDARPMAAHFELDRIDLMVQQFEYRSEMARQCGEALAKKRDMQIAQLLVKGAAQAQSQAVLDDTALDSNYGGTVVTDGDLAGADEAGALAVLAAIEADRVRMQELDIDPTGSVCAISPALFHQIRRLGVAEASSDLTAGAGRPMFGGVAEAGGLGSPLAQGLSISDSLTYMGTKLVASNNIPSSNVTTGDANYQVDARNVVGLIWKPEAVASIRKMDLTVDTYRDIRRNSELVVASMYSGGGIMRSELATVLKSA